MEGVLHPIELVVRDKRANILKLASENIRVPSECRAHEDDRVVFVGPKGGIEIRGSDTLTNVCDLCTTPCNLRIIADKFRLKASLTHGGTVNNQGGYIDPRHFRYVDAYLEKR